MIGKHWIFKQNMIKTIIFDFDGVILESLDVKTEAFKKLYQPYGPSISNKVVENHLENGGISRYEKIKIYHKQFLGKDLDDEKVQKIAQIFSDIVLDKIMKVSFVDGAKYFIEKNYEKYLMFISSATPTDELNFICGQRKISKYFKGIFGSPDSKSKHISFIMDNWSLKNNEIIFIGDSSSDLVAAEKHNVWFIGRVTSVLKNLINERYTLNDLNKLDKMISMINHEDARIN